ncbi:MAG: DUF2997 domain-containing protein [bacterium]|nr:DUF2997 domain-containing protein [bacterium]
MASNKEELEILIDETEKVTIHVRGVKGKSCVKKAENVANSVGRIVNQSFTSEYYDPEPKVAITDSARTQVKD